VVKAKPAEDGSPSVDLVIPALGYKNHIGMDRRHGLPAVCSSLSNPPLPALRSRSEQRSSPRRSDEGSAQQARAAAKALPTKGATDLLSIVTEIADPGRISSGLSGPPIAMQRIVCQINRS
jgi:hypothetical protein